MNEVIIYKNSENQSQVEVRFDEQTVCLNQDQLSLLFQKAKSTINEHIKNIYKEGELIEEATKSKFGISEFVHYLV